MSNKASLSKTRMTARNLLLRKKQAEQISGSKLARCFDGKYFFPASAGDEHQFRPYSWVPVEIGMIGKRDREQRPFVNFIQLA